jgi:hypothetical protein
VVAGSSATDAGIVRAASSKRMQVIGLQLDGAVVCGAVKLKY